MGFLTTGAVVGTAAAAKAATVAAVAGTAVAVGSSTAGFISAGKRKREAREATDKAEKAFADAERIASENKLAGMSIPKENIEQQRNLVIQNIAQTIQGAQEGSSRGAAAAGSRAGATGVVLSDSIRKTTDDALFKLDFRERLGAAGVQKTLTGLKLGEAQGQQMKAADLDDQAALLNKNAANTLSSFGKQIIESQNPFGRPRGTTSQINPTSSVTPDSFSQFNVFGEPRRNVGYLNPIGGENSFALGTTIFDPSLTNINLPNYTLPNLTNNPFSQYTAYQMPGLTGN